MKERDTSLCPLLYCYYSDSDTKHIVYNLLRYNGLAEPLRVKETHNSNIVMIQVTEIAMNTIITGTEIFMKIDNKNIEKMTKL